MEKLLSERGNCWREERERRVIFENREKLSEERKIYQGRELREKRKKTKKEKPLWFEKEPFQAGIFSVHIFHEAPLQIRS